MRVNSSLDHPLIELLSCLCDSFVNTGGERQRDRSMIKKLMIHAGIRVPAGLKGSLWNPILSSFTLYISSLT